jgi:hypothetical protein
VVEFLRRFFVGFGVGVTREDLVPLFLVTFEGQIRRPEGGSEWEPIKILLEGD